MNSLRSRQLAGALCAASLAALAALPALASAGDTIPGQLRRANLKPLLLSRPEVSPSIKRLIRNYNGPFGGIATPSISYGDITGDGRSEVVVPIFSGGTAGDIAYYVLGVVGGRVRMLRAVNDTYKVVVSIRSGKVVERVPIFGPRDPNCCPSRVTTTVFRWNGSRLVVQSRTTRRT
jgi:hypothetical protein